MSTISSWSTAQKAAVIGSIAVMLWSLPGLVINPDFAIGQDATAKMVLGVDMNGWHAISGFFVVVPVLAVFRNERLLPLLLAAAAGALYGTAIWAALSERPAAGLFYFPHEYGDALLHIVVGSVFAFGSVAGYRAQSGGDPQTA